VNDATKREADALMARLSVLTLAGIALDRATRFGLRHGLPSLVTLATETQKRVTAETKRAATAHSNLIAADRRKSFRAV
jgi:hypothetical protein